MLDGALSTLAARLGAEAVLVVEMVLYRGPIGTPSDKVTLEVDR